MSEPLQDAHGPLGGGDGWVLWRYPDYHRPGAPARLAEICLRTGNAGSDASALTSNPDLLADVYLNPYLALEPEYALVAEIGDAEPAGYVVATPDTARFVDRYRSDWLPGFAARYAAAPTTTAFDRDVLAAGLAPERMLTSWSADHPAHLHIDIAEAAQGRGIGRALVQRCLETLRAAGVPGVHLGVDPRNTGALAFYPRLGFTEARRDADVVVFVRELAQGDGRRGEVRPARATPGTSAR